MLIGSRVARLVCADGHRVRIIDKLTPGHAENRAGLAVGQLVGPAEEEASGPGFAGASCGYRPTASVGNARSTDDPVHASTTNVLGTRRVLEEVWQHAGPNVAVSSSANVFGELQFLSIGEDHPLRPDSPYGVSKLAEKEHGLVRANVHGMDAVALGAAGRVVVETPRGDLANHLELSHTDTGLCEVAAGARIPIGYLNA